VRGCGPPPTHSTRPMAARRSDRARQGIIAAGRRRLLYRRGCAAPPRHGRGH
jgi:hypothetical protein